MGSCSLCSGLGSRTNDPVFASNQPLKGSQITSRGSSDFNEVLLREVRHGSNISLLIRSIKVRLQHASTRCDGEFLDKNFGKFPASFFGQSHAESQYQ